MERRLHKHLQDFEAAYDYRHLDGDKQLYSCMFAFMAENALMRRDIIQLLDGGITEK